MPWRQSAWFTQELSSAFMFLSWCCFRLWQTMQTAGALYQRCSYAGLFVKPKDCKSMNQNARAMLPGSTTVLHDSAWFCHRWSDGMWKDRHVTHATEQRIQSIKHGSRLNNISCLRFECLESSIDGVGSVDLWDLWLTDAAIFEGQEGFLGRRRRSF